MPYGFPDISGFYDMLYGTAGVDFGGLTVLYFGGASGIVFSGNPPFTINDFLSIYSKFFGPPTNYDALTIQAGSNIILGFDATTIMGLKVGQLVVSSSVIPDNTLITAVDSDSITISNDALLNSSQMTAYMTPFVPLIVIMTYITLAKASVMFSRYGAAWFMMMCYFVAHYLTLFMRTESGIPNVTASQVASSGLTKGIIVSRAAGDVSATSKVITGYEEWGAWAETQYGELFITIARSTNCGAIWVP